QVAVGVDDGEPPCRSPLLGGDGGAGDVGADRPEARDLAWAVVEPRERGEPDPDLDTFAGADPVAGPPLGVPTGSGRVLVGPIVRCGARGLIGVVLGVGPVLRTRLAEQAGDNLALGEAVEGAVEHAEVEVGADLG